MESYIHEHLQRPLTARDLAKAAGYIEMHPIKEK